MAHTKNILDGQAAEYQTIEAFRTDNESEISELQESIARQ